MENLIHFDDPLVVTRVLPHVGVALPDFDGVNIWYSFAMIYQDVLEFI